VGANPSHSQSTSANTRTNFLVMLYLAAVYPTDF